MIRAAPQADGGAIEKIRKVGVGLWEISALFSSRDATSRELGVKAKLVILHAIVLIVAGGPSSMEWRKIGKAKPFAFSTMRHIVQRMPPAR